MIKSLEDFCFRKWFKIAEGIPVLITNNIAVFPPAIVPI